MCSLRERIASSDVWGCSEQWPLPEHFCPWPFCVRNARSLVVACISVHKFQHLEFPLRWGLVSDIKKKPNKEVFNLLPLRILVPSAGQRWSSSVTSVASWAVFPVRSELRHFFSNVLRCRFSVFTLFCCTTPSWLTTSRTNSHASFDFNFLLLTLGNYTPKGIKK